MPPRAGAAAEEPRRAALVLRLGHAVGRTELMFDASPTLLWQPVEVHARAEKLDVAA